jgi:hypothetical protein
MEILFILISIIILTSFGILLKKNHDLSIKIKDLEEKNSESIKRIYSELNSIKSSIKEGSKGVLEAAKGHIDTAIVAVSKRIGKRKSPEKDQSSD